MRTLLIFLLFVVLSCDYVGMSKDGSGNNDKEIAAALLVSSQGRGGIAGDELISFVVTSDVAWEGRYEIDDPYQNELPWTLAEVVTEDVSGAGDKVYENTPEDGKCYYMMAQKTGATADEIKLELQYSIHRNGKTTYQTLEIDSSEIPYGVVFVDYCWHR